MTDADLIVLGAGMAGLTAAARAAVGGARVIVVERASQIGGSALLSGGYVWSVPTMEGLLAEDSGADPELGAVIIDGLEASIRWIRETGVDVAGPGRVLRHGRGYKIDIGAYLSRCANMIRAHGGHVLMEAVTQSLLVTAGQVTGISLSDRDGQSDISSSWVLLATGGYQGDPELRSQLIGPEARQLLVRSNSQSRGDGLRLAQAAGGRLARRPRGFYGHLIAWPLSSFTPRDFLRLAFISSDLGYLANEMGAQFTNEQRGDHHNAQAVARQPGQRAVLIIDERIRQVMSQSPHAALVERIDRVQEAIQAGAHVAMAASPTELGTLATEWGFYGEGVAGIATHAELTPPYYAIEVAPSITFGFGGIDVDSCACVLGDDGERVGGLLAAGADAAGVYQDGYAGGLSLGATFALAATRTMGIS